jgi:hypothetical protein
MDMFVNIDIPDLARAVTCYSGTFGLTMTRRFARRPGARGES